MRRWRSYAGPTVSSAPNAPKPPAARSRAMSTSVIAVTIRRHWRRGTIFHGTKLPLRTWFLAIYLLTQRKNSISALQLSRELGVSYNTAWKLKHEILQVIFERSGGEALLGPIEIDDAYLGGEHPGKRGRGAAAKFPFIAAVQTSAKGSPQRVQLRRVRGFTHAEIRRYAQAGLASGSHIVSDGCTAFAPSTIPPTRMSASSPATEPV